MRLSIVLSIHLVRLCFFISFRPLIEKVHDHGLDLEFPDYTLARHLLSSAITDGILEPVHIVELVLETYELPLPLSS